MSEKKKCLNSNRCFLHQYFDEKDLELFEKMAIMCIKYRMTQDNFSFNHMRNLYKRLRVIVKGY